MSCDYTIDEYISVQNNYQGKILAIDTLIDLMLLNLAKQAGSDMSGINEYQLDDGQIKIRTVYTSLKDLEQGIRALETLKQMYLNRMHGRTVILRDINAFKRR